MNEGELQAQLQALALKMDAVSNDVALKMDTLKKVGFKKEPLKMRVLRWDVDGEEDKEF